ncbi:unnamed protein product [Rotaria sp. Silwood2]|nr:unnamed protein product [Rotaria sp. Silwood2]CAF2509191.1 unnamed protein product [Rotaria sp. Silwood2]CAF2740855.1 unnamed protein product [Rotaria sp. Silwood2]CAF2865814.1 unnamed protein product [Rotaria sp. Silwood2]CAF3898481.1 unnamed protein product [Rotaria sp. Silwood2]
MDESNNNIFDVLESPSSTKILKITSTSTNVLSMRRSHLPLINAGNGLHSSSTSTTNTSSSSNEPQRKKRKDRALQDLGFVNPGPKNLVNVANVPSRRLKTRQSSAQEKPSSSKPLYDKSGLLVSDETDRCDCNRLTCLGCFLPCTACHSSKCGLECRNLRTYTYEYRLFGTNKEIIQ